MSNTIVEVKKELIISICKSKKGTHYLQFTEAAYDEDGLELDDSTKTGFKRLKPGSNPHIAKANAEKKKWTFSEEPDSQGAYEVFCLGVNEEKGDEEKGDNE